MYKATNLVWQRFDSLHLICLTRLLSRWRNSPHLCMNCSELYHQDMPAPSLYPIIQLSNYGQQSNHCVSISPKTFPKKQDHFSHSNTLFSVKKRQLFRFFHIILQFTKAHLHCTPVSTHPTHPPTPTHHLRTLGFQTPSVSRTLPIFSFHAPERWIAKVPTTNYVLDQRAPGGSNWAPYRSY